MNINKVIVKLVEFFGKANGQSYRTLLTRIQSMSGASGLFKRMASAKDSETLLDYLAEVKYNLVFTGLGFRVEIEPYGKAGPDLKITRGGSEAIVEVKRFRPIHPGPPASDPSNADEDLEVYGDSKRDTNKV